MTLCYAKEQYLNVGRIDSFLGFLNSCVKSEGSIHKQNIIIDRLGHPNHYNFHPSFVALKQHGPKSITTFKIVIPADF